MADRPILFSAPMIRALLAGTKTQTRRAVKLPHNNPLGRWEPTTFGGPDGGRTKTGEMVPLQGGIWHTRTGDHLGCPYGEPGDRLWVRETWIPDPEDDGTWAYTQWSGCKDSSLSDIPRRFQTPEHCIYRSSWSGHDLVWRSPIFMPRWASRITLEITGVRVERLQDISEADARAEGASFHDGRGIGHSGWRHDYGDVHADARSAYARLWTEINGPGSWDANPWVWVVEFRRAVSAQGEKE